MLSVELSERLPDSKDLDVLWYLIEDDADIHFSDCLDCVGGQPSLSIGLIFGCCVEMKRKDEFLLLWELPTLKSLIHRGHMHVKLSHDQTGQGTACRCPKRKWFRGQIALRTNEYSAQPDAVIGYDMQADGQSDQPGSLTAGQDLTKRHPETQCGVQRMEEA